MAERKALKQNEQREAGIRARNGLDRESVSLFSASLVKNIAASEVFKRAAVVMIYCAVGNEADLSGLVNVFHKNKEDFKSEEKIFVYPFCIPGKERKMLALRPYGRDAFRKGMLGIPEPDPLRAEVIDPADIDLVICPCTSFDEDFHRIGMGAGYYDRFLKKCTKAAAALAAFECQRAERIEPNEWDIPVDWIFTEKGIRKRM